MAAALVAATVVALAEGTVVALVTLPWLARPCPTAIDLLSGTGIEADSSETDLTGIGTDLAIIGSLGTGLPFLAWASLTAITTMMTATPAYGPAGDGAGGTRATEREQ
jgi:hypothetical protein